ncbi:MAG: family 20 glycosylhydrolase [Alloprevotella sp.]|nr:family 20 glycosylhydrolase [Alloprevotella sp.]
MRLKKAQLCALLLLLSVVQAASAIRERVTGEETPQPAYQWRGCMLDVSRHYFPMSYLRQQIDILAANGFNRLHLHLVDAAGWRMEIRRYPRLTRLAAWRTESDWDKWWEGGDRQYVEEGTPGAYGGWYSQDELRALVAYAEAKGIVIVPEIEMPGHSEEVLEAYPELRCEAGGAPEHVAGSLTAAGTQMARNTGDFCPANEAVYTFLENVLTEVMQVFPSEYIHIGGDEAGKAAWPSCPRCIAKMQELGTQDVDALQAYLVRRMTKWLNDHGRRVIGWDEIVFDGEDGGVVETAPGNAVMVWRDAAHAKRAIEKGYDVILSPASHCYLDYYQDAPPTQPKAIGGFLPLEKVYGFGPCDGLSEQERAHVLGVQGNLWAEYIDSPSHAQYMLYPRIFAIGEIGLKGTERPAWKQFRKSVVRRVKDLRRRGINAFDPRTEAGPRPESRKPLKHKARGAQVVYNKPYSAKYAAGGATALTDGLRGGWTHGDGRWQGFVTGDCLDVTIDLGSVLSVRRVAMDFLQSSGSWIYLPKHLTLSVSADGQAFREIFRRDEARRRNDGAEFHTYEWNGSAAFRFLRIQGTATGEGEWIFLDEVVVQ